MSTHTKLALGGLAITLLASCSPERGTSLGTPRTWKATGYNACKPNATPLTGMDFDLVATINDTEVEFGRFDAFMSMRPHLIRPDGSSEVLGASLATGLQSINAYTFSPDGSEIILNVGTQDPQHAMLEELLGRQIFTPATHRRDIFVLNIASGSTRSLTNGPDQVSYFNQGGAHMPDGRILFGAMIGDDMRGYVMNADGSDKTPQLASSGFAYGLSVSPDGLSYAYHADYQVHVGDFATGTERAIEGGCPFEFLPTWSPDSTKIAFYCGDRTSPDLFVADRNGRNARLIGRRNGYSGVVPFFSGYDFHGGGSDLVAWNGSSSVFFAARAAGGSIELFLGDTSGGPEVQATNLGAWSADSSVSPDGRWLAFTSNASGSREVYLKDLSDPNAAPMQYTNLGPGCGARYPKWRPK